jgi:energy-coupling factor transporter ATP-binding protein EcfA2
MLLQKRVFDWSQNLPAWQSDLLRRLTAGPLGEVSRREVLQIMAGSSDAPATVALQLSDLPGDAGEHGTVELRAIRDLRNINCLAGEQSLAFTGGLNVVFGDNGSGKSGYGRLTRRVTRSGEPEEILRDVFDPGPATDAQTAQFVITVDGAAGTHTIDLADDPPRVLSAIATFDAGRARICVTKPNVIEHIPRPLRLLGLLSRTQDELAGALRDHADQVQAKLPALPNVSADTAAGAALASLDADTDVATLLAKMALSDEETETLARRDAEAAAIATDQTRQLEAAARARAAAARSAAEKLRDADARLSPAVVDCLAELRTRLDGVIAAEVKLAEEAFGEQRLQDTGSDGWRAMWLAAKHYAQSAGFAFPDPDGNTPCPVCQQDLDAAAADRVQRFEQFVTGDLRTQVTELEKQIDGTLAVLPNIENLRAAVEPELRELPEPVTGAAERALSVLDARALAARQPDAATGEPPATADELELLDVHAREQDAAAERQAGLRDAQRQQAVLREREELHARAAVTAAADAVRRHVQGLRRIARIEAAVRLLGTQKITTKLRELQQLAVTDRLRKAIDEEVSQLHPLVGTVEITGQATKAQTVIHLKLNTSAKAKLDHVLSDGEQRALALGFFLAEVAVSDECSAIVLDDPVSSLDHVRRLYLARRLAQESRRRQVIVYTHDMVFVHMLQTAAIELGVELHGQTLERAFHRVGMVSGELPSKMLGTGKQIKKLRHRLRFDLRPLHKHQDPTYEQEADRWVNDLRKAYDQIIEDTVLNDVVRRFNAHVQIRRLHGIKWSPAIAERIDAAMRKASPKSHHEAVELHPAALAPDELDTMLSELVALYDELRGAKPAGPVQVPEPTTAEPVIRRA